MTFDLQKCNHLIVMLLWFRLQEEINVHQLFFRYCANKAVIGKTDGQTRQRRKTHRQPQSIMFTVLGWCGQTHEMLNVESGLLAQSSWMNCLVKNVIYAGAADNLVSHPGSSVICTNCPRQFFTPWPMQVWMLLASPHLPGAHLSSAVSQLLLVWASDGLSVCCHTGPHPQLGI